MDIYYVNRNAQSGGEHEVHKIGCSWMPENPMPLGYCVDCWDALRKARVIFQHVDGCGHCCEQCHKE